MGCRGWVGQRSRSGWGGEGVSRQGRGWGDRGGGGWTGEGWVGASELE